MRHGVDCPKQAHAPGKAGYSHSEDHDSVYDVDGVPYCGRCHYWMGFPVENIVTRETLQAEISNLKAIAQGVTHHETCWKSSEGYRKFLELRESVNEYMADGLHIGEKARRLFDALLNAKD